MTRRAVISGLLPLLREGDSYLILCHKSPDGDAVGSAEALRLLLAGLGKQAVCACADPLPEYLRFIPEIPFLCCPTPDCLPEYKILLTVDTADPSLLGGLAPLGESAFIKIDHHRSGKSYGKHEYTDPAAAATGEILFSLAKEADLLTPAVADALYTAIASDTGCLRYSNTTADTLSAAASLLRAGARQELINRRLFENKPLSRVKATAEGISRMELLLDGQAALLLVTKEMMKQGGYTAEDFGRDLLRHAGDPGRGILGKAFAGRSGGGGIPSLLPFQGMVRLHRALRPLRRGRTSSRRRRDAARGISRPCHERPAGSDAFAFFSRKNFFI